MRKISSVLRKQFPAAERTEKQHWSFDVLVLPSRIVMVAMAEDSLPVDGAISHWPGDTRTVVEAWNAISRLQNIFLCGVQA
jgi:hypothetical protein